MVGNPQLGRWRPLALISPLLGRVTGGEECSVPTLTG